MSNFVVKSTDQENHNPVMSSDATIINRSDASSLINDLSASISANWDITALSDLHSTPLTYGSLARAIAHNHSMFKDSGIRPGDKIAICGKNSTNWAIIFLSTLTYGAVAVPILNEFHTDSIHHLVSHSDARLLYTDTSIWKQLNPDAMGQIEGIFDIDSGKLLYSQSHHVTTAVNDVDRLTAHYYPAGIGKDNFSSEYYHDRPDDLAVINYTSGSTGMSKGVMITYGNLWSNARFAVDNIPFFKPGDGMVSMLPLAHMFGMMVELLFPLLKGCHVTFLGRVPSPKVLLDAFADVRPKLIVTVPLVIEKIVRNRILPALEKPAMRLFMSIPGIKALIYRKVRTKMINAFGGRLFELIVGGAALNPDIERLLRQIRFPYTVGYGMTECAPLISYCWWEDQKAGSCGKIVDRMRARIDSADPANTPGVLWVKGDNVMKGYYKNQEATDAAINNGWMNTGDICTIDSDGYLYIKGRDKSMILGPSGQNIYPEEIESKLNNLPFVAESIAVERNGKLVALVYPDYDAAEKAKVSKEKIDELMGYNMVSLNRSLPAYSRVAQIEIIDTPFEKTPKHSIKRYLYK